MNDDERAITKIHDAKGKEERKKALEAEEQIFDALLGVMADEIRKPPQKASSPEARTNWCLGQVVESPAKK